ncbi:MAG: hypothetical protein JW885_14440 [Deltaproteobacteria bacterium]|nr:hypothetical protein [Candidatus Zymogenaceae bacterium]
MGVILILFGITLFGLSFLYYLETSGYILMFSGFLLFILGLRNIKTRKRESIQNDTEKRVVTIADDSRFPVKNCANPNCDKEIRIDVNHCPHCGWKYQYFYSMKVFRPEDNETFMTLVDDLSKKTRTQKEKIAKKLTGGMIMRYSSLDILLGSKTSFEKFGCTVEVIHALTVFKPAKYDRALNLINSLSKQTGRTPDDLNRQLENGMIFKYTARETMAKSRQVFESFGCTVMAGELIPSP